MTKRDREPFEGAQHLEVIRSNVEDVVHMLECCGWDQAFADGELDELSWYFCAYRAHRGQRLFAPQDVGDHMWLVALGEVAVTSKGANGRVARIDRMREGGCVGAHALLDGQERSTLAQVSSDDAIVLLLTRADFERIAFRKPRMAVAILRLVGAQLCGRLREATAESTGLRSVQ